MARRNIGNRVDIQPDALRQRRDLYAIAIGLMLFYAAGGGFSEDANVGTMFAIHLKRPELIVGAAWIGLFYFWWRFWLITEARPIADFFEDIMWQAGDLRMVRRVASTYVTRQSITGGDASKAILEPGQHVPKIQWNGFTPRLSLAHLRRRRNDDSPKTYGNEVVQLNAAEAAAVRSGCLLAIPRAMWWERSFTDYTLPHLFAAATVVVAMVSTAIGYAEATKSRTAPEAHPKVPPTAARASPRSASGSVKSAPPAAASTTVPKPPNVSPKVAPQSALTR